MLADTLGSHPFEVVYAITGVIVGVLGIIALVGLVMGQFRRGVVTELRASLNTANTELDIERKRSDRLEDAVKNLETRLAALEAENRVLRETLQTGLRLAPEFKDTMVDLLRVHEEKSAILMDHLGEKLIGHIHAEKHAG